MTRRIAKKVWQPAGFEQENHCLKDAKVYTRRDQCASEMLMYRGINVRKFDEANKGRIPVASNAVPRCCMNDDPHPSGCRVKRVLQRRVDY